MAQTLAAPSTVSAGSLVIFPDGTTTNVSASGTISCPDNFVSALLNAGYEYAASDAGSLSNASSGIQSSATSAGLADSVSLSGAVSAGLADSQSRSDAVSAGLADSVSRSEALSAGASASVARSSITSGSV